MCLLHAAAFLHVVHRIVVEEVQTDEVIYQNLFLFALETLFMQQLSQGYQTPSHSCVVAMHGQLGKGLTVFLDLYLASFYLKVGRASRTTYPSPGLSPSHAPRSRIFLLHRHRKELWLQADDVQVATLATSLDSDRKLAMRAWKAQRRALPPCHPPEECSDI